MRSLALVLLGMSGATPALAQTTDTVLVTLRDGEAVVRQRLEPEGDAVQAFAMRLDEQTLDVTEVVREGEALLDATLTPTDRAYRFDIASGAPVLVSYTVRGSTERIPLFVTGGRAELTVVHEIEAPFLIRVEGPEDAIEALDLPTSLPRFFPTADGAVEVAVSSLPALVRLSEGGALSFTRVADLVVLALILAGAIWIWRNARVHRERTSAGR